LLDSLLQETKMLKVMDKTLQLNKFSKRAPSIEIDDLEKNFERSTPAPSELVRQNSSSSLPGQRIERKKNLGFHRNRLFSHSFQRLRKRRKLTVEPHTSSNNNKNNNSGEINSNESSEHDEDLEKLKKIHDEFEEFLNVVVDDLSEKVSKLRLYRTQEISNSASVKERNYTSLQIYMLDKYRVRIERFRRSSCDSVDNIFCLHNRDQPTDVSNMVKKYNKAVSKMKRRMKDMIDVTDKYAVVEIIDNLNILNEASKDLVSMDTTNEPDEKSRKSIISVLSVPNDVSCSSIGDPVEIIPCPNMTIECEFDKEPKKRSFSVQETNDLTSSVKNCYNSSQYSRSVTFRSLSDHLCILRKSFLR